MSVWGRHRSKSYDASHAIVPLSCPNTQIKPSDPQPYACRHAAQLEEEHREAKPLRHESNAAGSQGSDPKSEGETTDLRLLPGRRERSCHNETFL